MMKRFAISVAVSIALGVLVLPLALPTPAPAARPRAGRADALQHTIWWVELRAKGQKPMPDALVFEQGKFDSLGCHAFGFGSAPYEAKAAGKAVVFQAMTKSAGGETMAWKGKAEGNSISGTMVWKKAKGGPMEVAFFGKRHTAEGALDATDWKVTLNTEGEKPVPDTLVFGEGEFDSKACHAYGFGKGPYNAMKNAGETTFTAFTTSSTEGTMEWRGEVKGDKIAGAMTLYPMKGGPKKYTFSGTKGMARPR
ncbi:MAG: hypothetical protein ACE149_03460 [Armatimonadota bacterium]